jgi:hypothetical protein
VDMVAVNPATVGLALSGIGAIGNYFSNKDAAKRQAEALREAAAQQAMAQKEYMAFLQSASDREQAFNERGLSMQQDMFNRSLAEQGRGTDLSLRAALSQGALGMGAGLASANMGQNLQLALMRASMDEAQPQTQAGLSALQALPYLQAALGLPAYSMPTSINTVDPNSLRQDYAGELQRATGISANLLNQQFGSTGQPGPAGAGPNAPIVPPLGATTAAGGTTPGGMNPTPYTYALNPTVVDPRRQLEMSPLFRIQQEENEKAMARQLANRGLLGSSQATSELGDMNRKLIAEESDRNIGRLSSMVNMGMGMAPLNTASQYSGGLMGNLNNISGMANQNLGLSNIYNQAAAGRQSMFQNFGTNMTNQLNTMGSNQAMNLGQMGQLGYAGGMQGAQNQLNLANVPRYGAADLFSTLGGLWTKYGEAVK